MIISEKIVITRKPHKCWGCGREFPKGSKLQALNNVDGGEICTTYWCNTCQDFWSKFMQDDDEGINMGDLKQDERWEPLRAEMEAK